MFRLFKLVGIIFLNVISSNVLFAQSDKLFKQNQKLIAEAHIEFVYHEPNPADRIKSFKQSTIIFSAEKPDTSSITQMWFDEKGQLIKYAETTKENGITTVGYEYYVYDKRGNVLFKIDSFEHTNYEWTLLQAIKKQNKGVKNQQEINTLEKELIRKGANKSEMTVGDVKKFVYDELGYLVYYTNLNVGYKAVVNYKLDEKKRLVEISTIDTNQSKDERTRITHFYKYDHEDRVIQISKKSELVSGNKGHVEEGVGDLGNILFSYDTSGDYKSIISKNNRYSDTTSYIYLYNSQKQRISTITLHGSDTTNIAEYNYENGLLKTEKNVRLQNSLSPAPESKGIVEYTYYPNKEIKLITYHTFLEDVPEPILDHIEFFEYTYY